MEKAGYRDTLDMLSELYPGKMALTVKEVAEVIGANVGTVYEALKRKYNTLPSKKVGGKIVVPIPAFAKWLC